MKSFAFIIHFIIITNSYYIFSQHKGLVKYGYVEALQIGHSQGFDYNTVMTFNKEQSYYVTAKDSLEQKENFRENKIYANDGSAVISVGAKVSDNGDQVVYNIKKKTIWSSLYCGNIFYVKESALKIKWKIEKETKKIAKFTCTKATANFRGRTYAAWFTTEIPLPFGPWKLNGLPGLILEAYDSNKSVYWYFKSVDYPSKTAEKVKYLSIPSKEKILSYEDFKNIQIKQLDKISDKLKIAKKQYPDVEFFPPTLSEMFLECE